MRSRSTHEHETQAMPPHSLTHRHPVGPLTLTRPTAVPKGATYSKASGWSLGRSAISECHRRPLGSDGGQAAAAAVPCCHCCWRANPCAREAASPFSSERAPLRARRVNIVAWVCWRWREGGLGCWMVNERYQDCGGARTMRFGLAGLRVWQMGGHGHSGGCPLCSARLVSQAVIASCYSDRRQPWEARA